MAKRKVKSKARSSRQVAFTRFMFVVAVFVLWIGGISVRLVHLQVNQHEWLAKKASDQRQNLVRSRLPRGTIYDRNGRALAMSVKVNTLYANPMEIDDLASAAKAVGKAVGVKENDVLRQLRAAKEDGRKYVPLAKGLDTLAAERINLALETPNLKKAGTPKFAGLYWRDEQKRSYPHQSLAAHIVGFSNADGVGQAGIEQSQNELLYGAVIRKEQERDRLGRVYDETVFEQEEPSDVVLTISTSMQYKVEEALQKAVVASGAKSGMAVVIDQKTGEILAMANYPTFDPNSLKGISKDNLTDRVIQSVYSPGSVFKLVTYGSALEKKLITPEGMIDAGNGTIEVAKHKFRDSHGIGSVTYAKALAHSSNVCAIKTGMRVGKDDFYSMLQKLGFGRRTGVELPAESPGIVRSPAKWNGDSLASMSIGYEIGVSALQMVSAFATIANDGVKIQPHIIKEIQKSGAVVNTGYQPDTTRVVSVETARDLRKMLREVVLSGTGRRAQLDGYSSAGKTGTAWKFDEVTKKVSSSKYISSFIGMAPAENPAVTIGVVMDEPKIGGRDGGVVAAPVFKEIAEQILPELGVSRDGPMDNKTAAVEEIPEAVPADPGLKAPAEDRNSTVDPQPRVESNTDLVKRVDKSSVSPNKKDRDEQPKAVSRPKATEPAKQKAPTKNKSST
ncbi:MAG: penicillin-binding protein 2 [Acidobacteriota bacterium]